jgi:hypothetical protein
MWITLITVEILQHCAKKNLLIHLDFLKIDFTLAFPYRKIKRELCKKNMGLYND